MGSPMAELDTSYRTPRHRPGMDPNTRRLAMIAGGIGAALLVMIGAWSLTGGKSDGIPVIEADARPLRIKPEGARQGPYVEEPANPRGQALAPTPEAPNPEALKAQAERAAAEKLAAEKLAAEKLAAERLAAEQLAADRARTAAATPPAAASRTSTAQAGTAPASSPPASSAPASSPARPPTQPVALTSPIAPAPAAAAPPRQAQAPAQAPARAQAASTQTGRTQVQLAAVSSERAALNEWNRLERRMPDILGGRRPAVIRFERDGKTIWRLRTGGFADTSQARGFCEKVRAKGGNCTVAAF
jgi:hypothetical protein